MGKTTSHETTTTWTCDRCGRQEITSETTASENHKLPGGWVGGVFFGGEAKVCFNMGSYAPKGWNIECSEAWVPTTKLWCCDCRKDLKVDMPQPMKEPDKYRWWNRFLRF